MRLVQVIKSANNPIVPVVHRVKAVSDAAKGKGRQGDSEDGAFYVEQTLISYANFVSAPKRPAGDRAAGSIATVQLAASETMALYGEIPITKELLPSSNFLLLNVEVPNSAVDLLNSYSFSYSILSKFSLLPHPLCRSVTLSYKGNPAAHRVREGLVDVQVPETSLAPRSCNPSQSPLARFGLKDPYPKSFTAR